MGGAERIGQFCAEADVSGAVGSSELGLDGLNLGLFCSCVLVRDSEFFTSSNLGLGLVRDSEFFTSSGTGDAHRCITSRTPGEKLLVWVLNILEH